MRVPSSSRALIAILLAFSLLARAAGGHLHLCFDGQEPPMSVHGLDAGLHHLGMAGGEGHSDQDVDLASAMPQKASSSSPDGAVLLGLIVLFFFLPIPRPQRPPFFSLVRLDSSPPFLLPPLRGPPH